MSKLYIHPYPSILTDNVTRWSKRVGSVATQVDFSIKQIDRGTYTYQNPEVMKDIEQFPNQIHMGHNELARRLLDKIS